VSASSEPADVSVPSTSATRVHIYLSVFDELFLGVLHELERTLGPLQLTVAAWHPEVEARALSSGLCVRHVYRLWETIAESRRSDARIDPASLRDLDQALAPRTLWEAVVAEYRANAGWNRQRVLRTVDGHWRAISDLYDRYEPDFVLMDSVSCLASYVHWGLAQARGIPALQVMASRTPGHIYITENEFGMVDELPPRYAHIRAAGLTEDERARAVRFLDEFQASRARPTVSTIRAYDSRPTIELGDAARLLRHARLYARQRERYALYGSPLDAVASRIRRIVRDRRSGQYFDLPHDGEPYVVYPLHFEPEAATLVSAPYFRDQAALIEQLAMALPVDHILYVKEHRISAGRRPLAFYERIASNHNVRLIDPFVDSFDLVWKSAGVATITGTMGWEALLMQKPVLTVGNVFYNDFPAVLHVDSPEALPLAFTQLLGRGAPDREALLEFVAAYLDCMYAGEFQHPDDVPSVLSNENFRHVAAAIASRWSHMRTAQPNTAVQ
jgi:hypothetical protein